MSRRQKALGLNLAILLMITVVAGAGCRTCGKAPCFHADASVRNACDGKPADNHDIVVNDDAGVGVSDECVVIGRYQGDHGQGHWVRWLPKSSGHPVSIVFVLAQNQPVPFEDMSCGQPDANGNSLCVLINCPNPCKTAFRSDYQPFRDPGKAALNYYYYSPGVTGMTRGESKGKASTDPGIRIDP